MCNGDSERLQTANKPPWPGSGEKFSDRAHDTKKKSKLESEIVPND